MYVAVLAQFHRTLTWSGVAPPGNLTSHVRFIPRLTGHGGATPLSLTILHGLKGYPHCQMLWLRCLNNFVRYPGSVHDSRVLKNRRIFKVMFSSCNSCTALTVGAKVWSISRALEVRHLQHIFSVPMACSVMESTFGMVVVEAALYPPFQWLLIWGVDGHSVVDVGVTSILHKNPGGGVENMDKINSVIITTALYSYEHVGLFAEVVKFAW